MPQDLAAEFLVKKHARAQGVPENVMLGMAKQESGFKPEARSKAGARGVLQVMPQTGRRFVSDEQFSTVEGQIEAGAKYYKHLRDRYGNDEQAVAGYHAGEGAVDKAIRQGKRLPGTYDRYAGISTQDHVNAVLANSQSAEPDLAAEFLSRKAGAVKSPSNGWSQVKSVPRTEHKVAQIAVETPSSSSTGFFDPNKIREQRRANEPAFDAARIRTPEGREQVERDAYLRHVPKQQQRQHSSVTGKAITARTPVSVNPTPQQPPKALVTRILEDVRDVPATAAYELAQTPARLAKGLGVIGGTAPAATDMRKLGERMEGGVERGTAYLGVDPHKEGFIYDAARFGGGTPKYLIPFMQPVFGATDAAQAQFEDAKRTLMAQGVDEAEATRRAISSGQKAALPGAALGIARGKSLSSIPGQAAQNAAQQFGSNLLAQEYDPQRSALEGVGKAAATGALGGGAFKILADAHAANAQRQADIASQIQPPTRLALPAPRGDANIYQTSQGPIAGGRSAVQQPLGPFVVSDEGIAAPVTSRARILEPISVERQGQPLSRYEQRAQSERGRIEPGQGEAQAVSPTRLALPAPRGDANIYQTSQGPIAGGRSAVQQPLGPFVVSDEGIAAPVTSRARILEPISVERQGQPLSRYEQRAQSERGRIEPGQGEAQAVSPTNVPVPSPPKHHANYQPRKRTGQFKRGAPQRPQEVGSEQQDQRNVQRDIDEVSQSDRGIQPSADIAVQREGQAGQNQPTYRLPNESREGAQPEWVKQNLEALTSGAEKSGLADRIEDLAARGLTAKEIARDLNADVEVVRAVRARRGIPSADDTAEFQAWQGQRQGTLRSATESQPRSVTVVKNAVPRSRKIGPDDSLTTAIAKLGGIRPDTQEGSDIAKYLAGRERGRPGALNRAGLAADEMIASLKAEGWDFDGHSQLLEALRREQQGHKVYNSDHDYSKDIDAQLKAISDDQASHPDTRTDSEKVRAVAADPELAPLLEKFAEGSYTEAEWRQFEDAARYTHSLSENAIAGLREEAETNLANFREHRLSGELPAASRPQAQEQEISNAERAQGGAVRDAAKETDNVGSSYRRYESSVSNSATDYFEVEGIPVYKVEEVPRSERNRAIAPEFASWGTTDGKRILIKSGLSEADYAKVLRHELDHIRKGEAATLTFEREYPQHVEEGAERRYYRELKQKREALQASSNQLSKVNTILADLRAQSKETGRNLSDLVEERIAQRALPGMEGVELSPSEATALRAAVSPSQRRAPVKEKQQGLVDVSPDAESRMAKATATEKAQGEGVAISPLFKGTEAVARRITNGEDRFIEFAIEQAGLTREQAETALARYRKEKVIKIDPVGGQFAFTHGGFAEADTLRRAANAPLFEGKGERAKISSMKRPTEPGMVEQEKGLPGREAQSKAATVEDVEHYNFQTGQPVSVKGYHGTTSDIQEFNKEFLGSNTHAPSAKRAFFFSANPETAGSYTRKAVYDAELAWDNSVNLAVEQSKSELATFRAAKYKVKKTADGLQVLETRNATSSFEGDYKPVIDRLFPTKREAQEWLEAYRTRMFNVLNQKVEAARVMRSEQHRASQLKEGANIVPSRVTFKNPLVHDFRGEKYRDETFNDLLEKAEAAGYDGVILKNVSDNYGLLPRYDVIYAVFKPEQIRSIFDVSSSESSQAAKMPSDYRLTEPEVPPAKGEHGKLISYLMKSPDANEGIEPFLGNKEVRGALGLKGDFPPYAKENSKQRSAMMTETKDALAKALGKSRSSHINPEELLKWASDNGLSAAATKGLDTAQAQYRAHLKRSIVDNLSLKDKRGSGGPDTTKLIADAAELGMSYLRQGVRDFNQWSRRMLAEFGNSIRPYLQRAYDAANRLLRLEGEGGFVRIGANGKPLPKAGPVQAQSLPSPSRSRMQQSKDIAVDILNIPRTLKSSIDLSAAMRQGAMYTLSHPVESAKLFFGKQLRSLTNAGYEQFKSGLKKDADLKLMKDSELHLSSLADEKITQREEAFISKLAGRIPGVQRSEHAYVTFLDGARSSWFKQLARQAESAAKVNGKPVTADEYKAIAKFVNRATGRGDLGSFNDAAPILNAVFFAPRYAISKLQVLDPRMYKQMPKGARATAMREAAQYYATIGVVAMGLKYGLGLSIGTDPEDSEFMKLKVGNTRYDLTAGHGQYVVLAARLLRNVSNKVEGKQDSFGKSASENLDRFTRYKYAPIPSFIRNLWEGKNAVGEKTSLSKESWQLIAPMFLDDMRKAFTEEGAMGVVKTAPSFVGVGASTYERQSSQSRRSSSPPRAPRMPSAPRF